MTLLNDRSSNRKKSQPKGQQDSWVLRLLFAHSCVGGGMHQGAWPRARGVRMGTHLLSHTCTWGWGLLFSLKGCSPFQVTPLRGGTSFLIHSRSPRMLVSPAERRIKELWGWPREANSGLSTAYRIFTFISHLSCPETLPGTNYCGHFADRNTESQRDDEAPLGLPSRQEGGQAS